MIKLKIRAYLDGLRNAAKKAVQSGRLSECLENSPLFCPVRKLLPKFGNSLHSMPVFARPPSIEFYTLFFYSKFFSEWFANVTKNR